MRIRAAILAIAWALPVTARPAPVEVQGRASVGPAWDSNADRASAGAGPSADGAMRLSGDLEARTGPDSRLSATAGYRGGLDFFRAERDRDRGAHELSLAAAYRTGLLAPGVEGRLRVRHQRDGLHDTADAAAAATLAVGPVKGVDGTLRLGYRGFEYADEAHSFRGPYAGVSLRWAPLRRHLLAVSYEVAVRDHPDGVAYRRPAPADEDFVWVDRRPDGTAGETPPDGPGLPDREPVDAPPSIDPPASAEPGPSPLGLRHELAHAAGVEWTWRGPAIVGGGYTFSRVDSNGYGLDADRHRFHLLAAARLPGGLVGSAEAALQLVRFADGLFLSEELLLVDDEENLSSLSLQLSKPLGGGLSADLRYAGYVGAFRSAGLRYERHVAGTALTYRF